MPFSSTPRDDPAGQPDVIAALDAAVGPDRVERHDGRRVFFSTDLSRSGTEALAIVRPANTDAVTTILKICHAAGVSVIARGGGFSYTGGYLPINESTVIVDMRDLDQVIEINAEDMYVVVECGCTWERLYEALKAQGLRTPYFGPMSGYAATVGGALSQGSFFLGSSQYGPVADSVLAVEIVLADGSVLRTGSWGAAADATPFYRSYGPDFTGLFLSDTGALGFKTKAVLKLVPFPQHTQFLSFVFDREEAAIAAVSAVGRLGIAGECYCWDPYFVKVMAAQSTSLMQDLKLLAGVARGQKGSRGLFNAARLAIAGKSVFDGEVFMLNISIDDPTAEGADARRALLRDLLAGTDAREITPSAPMATRGTPFINFNTSERRTTMRNLPTNGLVPHSRLAALSRDVRLVLANRAEDMARHGIECGVIYFGVGQQGACLEPLIYWDDPRHFQHDRVAELSNINALAGFDGPSETTELAMQIRKELTAVMVRHGSAHVQIGKTYPWLATRTPPIAALIGAIKRHVDPDGRMNPGSLGLADLPA
ncbi:FAD-binding oxidoreductase [Novosphingobium sp.]|uniref:FAD-binding oxidoreductase n=1 Tax=Novosphingobium sp. TaxID=1874826 RepID=UPI0025EA3AB2|nr:FAD-binding oxidoreductase [Novosphingobium sp.]